MIVDVILVFLFVVILVLLFLMRKQLTSIETNQDGANSLSEEIFRSEQGIKDEVRSSQITISETLTTQLKSTGEMLGSNLTELGKAQTRELENVTKSTNNLTQSNETRIENVRKTVDSRLQTMQDSNERKLDEMRKTVDEQLQSTLEKRLTESFKMVSERLESVREGLGTMQELASDVGNLQRVLTNVSTRGAWGEVQLGAILEDTLTPNQYGKNVQPHAGSERVEYAIRLPGQDRSPNSYLWLPIDSKFPREDYERIKEASERVDKDEEQKAIRGLIRTVSNEAKTIKLKYIAPPHTTDFAIMFLPTEGLYAEVLRQPGLVQKILHDHSIIVAGPTTLSAILSSLRLGFQTLAIQEHSGEIREVLAAVKTECDKFGGIMEKLQKQLNTASRTVESTGARTRAMARHLSDVEQLPQEVASEKLGLLDTQ